MNKLLFIVLVLFLTTLSANTKNETYLINPIETPHGILLTNNYESALYLLNDGKLERLLSAPGCGRYIQISRNGNLVGLKYIDAKSRLQSPAIYDLEKRELIKLSEPVVNAGQVSFSKGNLIAYTIENELIIKDGEKLIKYDLNFYTNRATISPNGKSVIYKNNYDQLILYDLKSELTTQITDGENGFYNATWSLDNTHIAFQSINAKIFLYNLQTEDVLYIAEGENPRWSPDSKSIVFFNKEIDFANIKLVNSDLFEYKISTKELIQITNTKNRFEMNPSYTLSEDILYQNYTNNEIIKITPLLMNSQSEIIFKLKKPLETTIFYPTNKLKNLEVIKSLEQWEHIHQVFDTRDSGPWTSDPVNSRHQGYLSCGAATAMQAIASYNILPPDPIHTHGQKSNYGKYLSDSYTYNNNTYANFTISSNGRPGFHTGAHGYMWNNGGSPNSNAESFLRKHGIDATHSSSITWGKVKRELDLDFPYMLCTTSLTAGHIVLGIGQYGTGNSLYCNDPYGDKNAGNYGRIHNGKNAIYDWGDANTGHIKITPVVWGITARYSRTLRLTDTYPPNNKTDVSVSVNPKIYFYGAIDPTSVENKIELNDGSSFPITVSYDLSRSNEGIISIIPNQELKENYNYTITIHNGIKGTNGILFNQNHKISFSTGVKFLVDGNRLDDFEFTNNRVFTTSGVDENITSFNINSKKVFAGNNSAKLEYRFTKTNGSYCRVEYSPDLELSGIIKNSIGLWVYGDNSGNTLQYWFTNELGTLLMGYQKKINWIGWQFISVGLSTIENADSLTFNSFAIRQSPIGKSGGTLFFDDMILHNTQLKVINNSPRQQEIDVSVNSSIIVEFNKPVNVNLLQNAFQIVPATNGSFFWNDANTNLTFVPENKLIAKTVYQIVIDTSANALDGTKLNPKFSFSFKTEREKLSLISTYPNNNAVDISTRPDIVLSFDGAILSSTLVGNVLFQNESGENISIFVDQSQYVNGKIKFTPTNSLNENSLYKIILSENIGDTKGFTFDEKIEVIFTTETNSYISGNIFDDFENNSGWSNPYDTEGSVGLHYLSTRFIISNAKRKTGNYSGKLAYEFLGIDALCRTKNSDIPKISSQQNFGLWIFGDNSKNILEFWFVDDNSTIEKVVVDTLNWTGWKLKSITLSDFTSSDSLKFNSLVIKQTENGNISGTIYLDDMQTDIVLPVQNNKNNIPTEYSLLQNYPNPFNPSTTIKYSIPIGEAASLQSVTLNIYDILGRKVATLVNEEQGVGNYKVIFDATNLSSGIYFYRLQSTPTTSNGKGFVESKKMILVK